ncbi:MAG: hypothetical protein V8R14_00295 [Clostridia bacterium]
MLSLRDGQSAFSSLLAIVMAAVMLLPTYISMQSTYYISMEMPESPSFLTTRST